MMKPETMTDEAWNSIAADENFAEEITDGILENIPEECDLDGVSHALFVWMIHWLAEMGWSSDQLKKEIDTHHALQTTVGRMQ